MTPRVFLYCLFLLPAFLSAQTTLQVTDPDGEPLQGATVVRLPDAPLGLTDAEGELRVDVAPGDTLQVSYLGFRTARVAGTQVQDQTLRAELTARGGGLSLETATVVGRRNERAATLPQQIETVSDDAQRRVQSLTTTDALATLSGAYVQKSQLGAGSPVLHGFEANRVLLVVDGVRMNNAIYRNGHLQNAITVDPNALERTEILYGPGALAYGSDALGGVVHFRTRQPKFRPDGGTAGYLSANLGSAARAVNLAGGTDYGGVNWAGLTILSYTRFGDLRAGGNRPDTYGDFGLRREYITGDAVVTNPDPNRQVGSGYAQYNLLQKFRFRLAERLELTANLQASTTGDVPRYDALNEYRNGSLRWARWDYGPQTRLLGSLRLDDRRPTALYDAVSYLLAYQYVEEDRIQRRLGSPVTTRNLEDVGAATLQGDFTKYLNPVTTLRYGLDGRYDRVVSTSSPDDEPTRYPSGGSSLAAAGVYAEASRELGDRWLLRGGLRYGHQRLSATFGSGDPIEWPAAYLQGIVNPSDAVTATVGAQYREGGRQYRLRFAQGFRAPNVDDFAKFREQSGRVQVPNPNLGPERSNTLEAGYAQVEGPLQLSLTAYGTLLTNAVIRRNGTLPDGSASFVSRGDTLFVDTNVNAERAWIYGFDAAVAWQPSADWELHADAHWLRGRRRQEAPDGNLLTLPQDHIPPAYGRAGVRYLGGERWDAELRVAWQVRKQLEDYAVNTITGTAATGYAYDVVGSADNPELTPGGLGTPGWWTLNAYGTYRVSEALSVQLKVENALDRFYQPFASGIAAPGIDVGLGAHWRW